MRPHSIIQIYEIFFKYTEPRRDILTFRKHTTHIRLDGQRHTKTTFHQQTQKKKEQKTRVTKRRICPPVSKTDKADTSNCNISLPCSCHISSQRIPKSIIRFLCIIGLNRRTTSRRQRFQILSLNPA
ncbi:hypothetical protein CDAR_68151 [Caerostris darwini]|uniref:Uncharacterized protein n=1 Tax=Caerostris darwini TaxID=1538125 RepID=A0AAV4VSY0_9ARAC|nr:hypothetical protein CDAR_68151 [Caerostris darwini]